MSATAIVVNTRHSEPRQYHRDHDRSGTRGPDKRRGFPSLALLVQEQLKQDPTGHHFIFRGRRGDLLKIIWHDRQGACLFSKLLERWVGAPAATLMPLRDAVPPSADPLVGPNHCFIK